MLLISWHLTIMLSLGFCSAVTGRTYSNSNASSVTHKTRDATEFSETRYETNKHIFSRQGTGQPQDSSRGNTAGEKTFKLLFLIKNVNISSTNTILNVFAWCRLVPKTKRDRILNIIWNNHTFSIRDTRRGNIFTKRDKTASLVSWVTLGESVFKLFLLFFKNVKISLNN